MSKLPAPLNNLPLPIIGSPLFIISNPKLVIAQCIAGVVGSMPALNARPAEQLEEWLIEITEALAAYNKAHPDKPAAPFAINQIVHKSNDRLEHDMAMCVKYKVPIIITSLGAREDINAAAHSYGGVVLHDVINNKHARKAIEKGADGLIAVAAGAGGHAGVKSPFALIQEIRQWFDGPIALSGAISTGDAVLAAQAMGADNMFVFGLRTHEAQRVRELGYDPRLYVEENRQLQRVMHAIGAGDFSLGNVQRYKPLVQSLLGRDHYLLMADFASYVAAQSKVDALFAQPAAWAERALLNASTCRAFVTTISPGPLRNPDTWSRNTCWRASSPAPLRAEMERVSLPGRAPATSHLFRTGTTRGPAPMRCWSMLASVRKAPSATCEASPNRMTRLASAAFL